MHTFELHCLWSYLNITNVQCSLECYIETSRNISKKESVDLIIIFLCKNPKILMTEMLAWENRRHFVTPPLVSLWNDVWKTSAEIPYWWCITTHIWVVLLIHWSCCSTREIRFNQSEALCRSRIINSRGNHWLCCEMSSLFSGYFKYWVVTTHNVLCCRVLYVWKWSTVANLHPPEVSL